MQIPRLVNAKALARLAAIIVALVVPAGTVQAADDFPSENIEIMGGYPAGGWVDMTNRVLSGAIEQQLDGLSVVVVPTPGAGGAVATQKLITQEPSGYKLLLQTSGTLFGRPLINNLPFGPDDFTPIATVAASVLTISVRKDSPWKTFEDFIKDAEANPGKYSYTTAGPGGQGHLAMEAVKDATGIDVVHVPSNGGPASIAAVVGGHMELVAGDNSNPEIRPLVVTLPRRSVFFPDTPTMKEMGYNVEFVTRYMLTGPKGIPQERVDKLSEILSKAVEAPTYIAFLNGIQLEVLFEPASELKEVWSAEAVKLNSLIEKLGLAHYQQ
jgi:tripartite-type tricarboxylate transporter receptor subunit TctC